MLVDATVEDRAEGVERERTLLEVSDGPVVTLVRIAGLNVHLKDKKRTVQEGSFSATQKDTVNQSFFMSKRGMSFPPYQSHAKLMH